MACEEYLTMGPKQYNVNTGFANIIATIPTSIRDINQYVTDGFVTCEQVVDSLQLLGTGDGVWCNPATSIDAPLADTFYLPLVGDYEFYVVYSYSNELGYQQRQVTFRQDSGGSKSVELGPGALNFPIVMEEISLLVIDNPAGTSNVESNFYLNGVVSFNTAAQWVGCAISACSIAPTITPPPQISVPISISNFNAPFNMRKKS